MCQSTTICTEKKDWVADKWRDEVSIKGAGHHIGWKFWPWLKGVFLWWRGKSWTQKIRVGRCNGTHRLSAAWCVCLPSFHFQTSINANAKKPRCFISCVTQRNDGEITARRFLGAVAPPVESCRPNSRWPTGKLWSDPDPQTPRALTQKKTPKASTAAWRESAFLI